MPATNNGVARRAPRRVVLPWHKVVGVIALPVVLLAAGCTKSSCDQVPVAKVDFPWTDSLQLIPPGAKVCGVHASIPNELSVDFGDDPNPFVTMVYKQ